MGEAACTLIVCSTSKSDNPDIFRGKGRPSDMRECDECDEDAVDADDSTVTVESGMDVVEVEVCVRRMRHLQAVTTAWLSHGTFVAVVSG